MKKINTILFLILSNSLIIAQTKSESDGYQTVVKIVSNRLDTKVENYTTFYRNCIKTTYDCTGSGDLSCPAEKEETCTSWSPNIT